MNAQTKTKHLSKAAQAIEDGRKLRQILRSAPALEADAPKSSAVTNREMAAAVQAEVFGVNDKEAAVQAERLRELRERVDRLEANVRELARVLMAREAEFAAELKQHRKELGLAA